VKTYALRISARILNGQELRAYRCRACGRPTNEDERRRSKWRRDGIVICDVCRYPSQPQERGDLSRQEILMISFGALALGILLLWLHG
jgi:uncharacterized Zn finger protein (UPF0148 family)